MLANLLRMQTQVVGVGIHLLPDRAVGDGRDDLCEEISKRLESSTASRDIPRLEVNRMRRTLAMHDAKCFERHKDQFIEYFVQQQLRQTRRHLVLHNPKVGGTTLCSLAKRNELHVPDPHSGGGVNCQAKLFRPFWCCTPPEKHEMAATCQDIQNMTGFVMNENYLDYPLCPQDRLYTVLLRDPVDRAISHLSYLFKFIAKNKMNRDAAMWRTNLGQSNYQTWSLVAGRYQYPHRYTYPTIHHNTKSGFESSVIIAEGDVVKEEEATAAGPWLYTPQLHDLDYAKETLLQVDFLMDITVAGDGSLPSASPSHQAAAGCTDLILSNIMGMTNTSLDHERKGIDDKRGNNQLAESLNQLDIRLYDFAQQIIRVDCEFLHSVFNMT